MTAELPPLPPIDTLVAAIRDGRLTDDNIADLVDAINDRRARSEADQTRRALANLTVGTRVRLDRHVQPKYLQGVTGTIHQIDRTNVTVSLDTPVGRFKDGHINCSARVLQPIQTDT